MSGSTTCPTCRHLSRKIQRLQRENLDAMAELLDAIRENTRRHEPSALDTNPYRTGIHEAGHAIIAELEGLELGSVELRTEGWEGHPDLGDRLGNVTHGRTEPGSREWARSLLAGLAAEREHGAEIDLARDPEFREVADEWGRERASAELRSVQRLLRKHWRAVRAVQSALLRRWSISPGHVREIVASRPREMTARERAARLERWEAAQD